jgi:hypothetical protein
MPISRVRSAVVYERRDGERDEQVREAARRVRRVGDALLHRLEPGDGEHGVDLLHEPRHRGEHGVRCLGLRHEEDRFHDGLRVGRVPVGPGLFVEGQLLHVTDDADDLAPGVVAAVAQAPSER